MTLYVDPLVAHPLVMHKDARAAFIGRRTGGRWSHLMVGAEDSLDELHAFAARLGLKRSWAQHLDGALPHYDLTPSRRAVAVVLGAVEVSALEQGRRCARSARTRRLFGSATSKEDIS